MATLVALLPSAYVLAGFAGAWVLLVWAVLRLTSRAKD